MDAINKIMDELCCTYNLIANSYDDCYENDYWTINLTIISHPQFDEIVLNVEIINKLDDEIVYSNDYLLPNVDELFNDVSNVLEK